MSKTLALLLLIGLAWPAQAAIYKYVDAEGNITFTDRYRPGAVKVGDALGEPAGSTTVATPRRRASANPSPANFPKVDRQTQSRRDDVRRTLLLEERKNEENALASVRTLLSDNKPRNAAERGKLAESQRLHEKNIEMLDKELARIR